MMTHIETIINRINGFLGKTVSWLTLLMVLVMCISVVQRYLFQSNHIWQQELILFMHAVVFLTVAGCTLRDDGHVRVDMLYEHVSAGKKAWINLIGTVIFLFPVCGAVIYFSYSFISNSWEILERSREYDGLPVVFLLKTFIWVFAATLILQGISVIIRSISELKSQ